MQRDIVTVGVNGVDQGIVPSVCAAQVIVLDPVYRGLRRIPSIVRREAVRLVRISVLKNRLNSI
jgi:hypothetical protein